MSLTVADIDWLAMCNGQPDGMSAFMSGKVKATGNVMLAQQIRTLFPLLQTEKLTLPWSLNGNMSHMFP